VDELPAELGHRAQLAVERRRSRLGLADSRAAAHEVGTQQAAEEEDRGGEADQHRHERQPEVARDGRLLLDHDHSVDGRDHGDRRKDRDDRYISGRDSFPRTPEHGHHHHRDRRVGSGDHEERHRVEKQGLCL
jgi:hypothetical protein